MHLVMVAIGLLIGVLILAGIAQFCWYLACRKRSKRLKTKYPPPPDE
jgi:hypothetical protein